MREHKFRAWDTVNKCMEEIDGLHLYLADGRVYEVLEASRSYQTYMSKEDVSERYIPLQYTGLKDRNGKEIYEGDTVLDSFGNKKGNVRYNVYLAAFELVEYDGIHILSAHNSEKFFEVVGNIYENPELLT